MRPAGLETVQPVLPFWGFSGHPQTPPPEARPLDTLTRCAGLHASRPFREPERKVRTLDHRLHECRPVIFCCPDKLITYDIQIFTA